MDLSADQIRAAMDRIVASPEWSKSLRMGQFLRYVVGESLAGRAGELKESVVGVHVFERAPGYDTKADPVVRVEARRVRTKLQEYYLGSGVNDPLRIELPKGTYQPVFRGVEPVAAGGTGARELGRRCRC